MPRCWGSSEKSESSPSERGEKVRGYPDSGPIGGGAGDRAADGASARDVLSAVSRDLVAAPSIRLPLRESDWCITLSHGPRVLLSGPDGELYELLVRPVSPHDPDARRVAHSKRGRYRRREEMEARTERTIDDLLGELARVTRERDQAVQAAVMLQCKGGRADRALSFEEALSTVMELICAGQLPIAPGIAQLLDAHDTLRNRFGVASGPGPAPGG